MIRRIEGMGAILFLFLTFTPASAQVRGVTKDRIIAGAWVAMSGALAYPAVSESTGHKTYYDFANDQGGVYGRKIEYIAYNDDYSPPKSVAVAKKLVEKDRVFYFAEPFGTPNTLAALPVAKEYNVPIINPSASPTLLKGNNLVFLCKLNYYDHMRLMVDYLVRDKKLKRIALFGAKGEIGEITREGAVDRLKKYGLQLAAYDDASPDDLDVTAQFNKFRSVKADAVMISANPKPASLMLQEMKKQDWQPITFLYGALSDQVPKMAKEAAVGVFLLHWIPTVDGTMPGVQEHKKIMEKYAPKSEVNEYSLMGYVSARVAVEILKRAGGDLTVEKFIKAAETLNDFDTGTGIKITFTPTDHSGSKWGAISIVKGPGDADWKTLKLEKATGWIEIKD